MIIFALLSQRTDAYCLMNSFVVYFEIYFSTFQRKPFQLILTVINPVSSFYKKLDSKTLSITILSLEAYRFFRFWRNKYQDNVVQGLRWINGWRYTKC